ncbi:MAG: hypothetical protein ACK56F_06890 [bacterium]
MLDGEIAAEAIDQELGAVNNGVIKRGVGHTVIILAEDVGHNRLNRLGLGQLALQPIHTDGFQVAAPDLLVVGAEIGFIKSMAKDRT